MNRYLEMKERQQKEFNEFPMFFAFSNEQFADGMKKLGLKPNQTNKLYSMGMGGYYKKDDAPKLHEMRRRHDSEFREAIKADETGEGFILEMFKYELANHEYCITYDVSDTLDALGLTVEEVNSNKALLHGLNLGVKEQEGMRVG